MKRATAWLMSFCLILLCALPARASMIEGGGEQASKSEVREGNLEGSETVEKGAVSFSPDNNPENEDDTGSNNPDRNAPVEGDLDTGDESQVGSDPNAGVTSGPGTSPNSSANPTSSAAPKPSTNPDFDATPKSSITPTSSATPEAIATPTSSATPEAMVTPTSSATPDPIVSPTPSTSPESSASPSISPGEGRPASLARVKSEDWNNEYAPSNVLGSIEVILCNVLPAEGFQLTIWLEKDGQRVGDSKEVSLKNNAEKHSVSFGGLDGGVYWLKVSAPGFIEYKREIEINGNSQTAEIHTGFINLEGLSSNGVDFSYEEGKPHPGVMLIGDANRDGILDDMDKDAIMSAMSRGENGVLEGNPDENPTDLNRDGKTDLVDLQYYVNGRAGQDAQRDTMASLSGMVMPEAVKVNQSPDTEIAEGSESHDIQDLLKGSMISLQNKGGTEISEENPVEFGFNLQSKEQEQLQKGASIDQVVISMGDSTIQSGELTYETVDGDEETIVIAEGKQADAVMAYALSEEDTVDEDSSDKLVINLGGQVAVKKIVFRITGTTKKGTLADISKVEFLNGMENRIPEPKMDIPTGLSAEAGDKSFTLRWNRAENVTAYEAEITYNGETEVVRAASESLEVKSFKNNKLQNGEIYEVRVQSVNGTWRSGYGETLAVMPKVTKVPDPPDNLKAVGGYCIIRMNWKNMKDTDTYNVYYKQDGESSFIKVEGVAQNSYEITGLKEKTKYQVYVTGVNSLGEGGRSVISEAVTTTHTPAKMPNYKLINESNGIGKVSAHIVDVSHVRGSMVDSPLDTGSRSALGTVDKDFNSRYQVLDWDDGASYVSPDKGLLFTLDDYYQMSYITFAETEDIASYTKVSVYYYDKEHPNGTYSENPVVLQRTDENGRKFYLIKLAKPITANKVRLGFARYSLRNIVIAEVNFYHYDSLEDDILALYKDDLHTSLREDVTEDTINELQKRLDTVDAKSGEYHPEREVLQRELDNAKGLLANGFNDVIEIKTQITSQKDGHLGFGGLNAWQPLGVTAYEGEQIIIYVGHNQLTTGSNSALKLIATQYHAEAGAFASQVASLKVGRNEITIPSIQSLACEGGGALYIQYTGNNSNERYAVRVNGGVKEPVLDLYGVTDETKRAGLVTSYVKELEDHVASQERLHKEKHETAGEGNKVNREYDKQNCILGATEIVLDQMMLSVSAEQILAGLGNGSLEEKADKLNQSLRAMDKMMELFYHHKGLSRDEKAPATDRMPAQHLNIRYMRMFAGAFMYASGNHIGIEWGSVPGLASAVPVEADNGKYVSGNYFGWGIAHEIGHNINQGSYAIAEVTNNYFSVLAQAKERNDSVRFKYKDVYKKVTSNTVGKPSSVFTHLAMYWQLHLAYDRGYNYKIYDSYQQQQENLFYARVDSYSRNTASAPGNLKLNGGSDQNIMRLACAAAKKDLTEFFIRWGLVPDEETQSYASQFPKEERALYYLTDEARAYEIENGTEGSIKGENIIGSGSSVQIGSNAANEVNISIQCTADPDVILGYEIARYYYEDGESVRQVIGFTTENTYQDYVAVVNNRVMTYEVIAVDKFGYRSNAAVLGDVKISHDGSHDKSMWTVTTNMSSEGDLEGSAEEDDPCAPEKVSAISQIIDNNYKNIFTGTSLGEDAAVLFRFGQVLPVCGLKYTVNSGTGIGAYEVQVSVDGNTWTTVKTGRFENKESQTVYFENGKDPWVCTYDAAYVRLKAPGQTQISISEVDILGPSGDNISFGAKEDSTAGAVGILQEDYVYEKKDGIEKYIPKGSLIFTGSYKGNPAYNVVVIYDENGAIVGGVDEGNVLKASQIILANVPEEGLLGEVSRGTWIYWIEPSAEGQIPEIGGKVRAQLYRVDNALTNEGSRLVSDTLPLEIPQNLEKITLKNETESLAEN